MRRLRVDIIESRCMAEENPLRAGAGGTSGERAWAAEAYVEYSPGLRRFIVGVLRDRDAAEDVVQATFAQALAANEDVPPKAIKAWLYRVAFHEAVNWKRRLAVDRRAFDDLRDQLAVLSGAGDPNPVHKPLVSRDRVERVRAALGILSVNQLRVVRARIFDGRTFAQIAAEMNIPLGTALSHMRRALEKLRGRLKPDE
jgi:RNA polymerase sigma-70 factor (ECF subfamily)